VKAAGDLVGQAQQQQTEKDSNYDRKVVGSAIDLLAA
jgi:hypothetical protein